jgi:hypothetical protein
MVQQPRRRRRWHRLFAQASIAGLSLWNVWLFHVAKQNTSRNDHLRAVNNTNAIVGAEKLATSQIRLRETGRTRDIAAARPIPLSSQTASPSDSHLAKRINPESVINYTDKVKSLSISNATSLENSNFGEPILSNGAHATDNATEYTTGISTGISTGITTNDNTTSHVISWNGVRAMDKFVDSIWAGNLFCETIQKARTNASPGTTTGLPITLNITFGCQDLFENSPTGSGNFIHALYMMRASAAVLGNIQVHFTCTDAYSTRLQLILPWFTGSWYWKSKTAIGAQGREVCHVCGPSWTVVLDHVHQEKLLDLRRMAIALVGVRPHHPSADYADKFVWGPAPHRMASMPLGTTFVPQLASPTRHEAPLFPNVELDDAVIHFRCGDLLGSNLTQYGFMTFSGYVRHISSEARSIGILTQPFARDTATTQQRIVDADSLQKQRCKTLVLALKDYISERYPLAAVNIRNDANETIALAYARIVMANQSIGARSTFSVFPIVATFGTGYYLRPANYTPDRWLERLSRRSLLDPLTGKPNLVLFEEANLLIGSHATEMWDSIGENAVLSWFRR